MPIRNLEELCIQTLSNIKSREERAVDTFQSMSQAAENDEVKKILDTRVLLTKESIQNIDECFKLLGKQPMAPGGPAARFQETFVEDVRKEAREIEGPVLRAAFVLHRAQELVNMHTAAYVGLIALAEAGGYWAVSALLETNLASRMVFLERTRRLIVEMVRESATGGMRRAA